MIIAIAVQAIFFFAVAFGQAEESERFVGVDVFKPENMTNACLACICQAATKCAAETPCDKEGDHCGIFRMKYKKWVKAGMPLVKTSEAQSDDRKAYVTCAADSYCAAETMTNYYKKFAKDCNFDGVIDCLDYAIMEEREGSDLPPCGPDDFQHADWWEKFITCYDLINSMGLNE